MPEQFTFLSENWEEELLNLTSGAIECAIASAYLTPYGVDFLSKISDLLAESTNKYSQSKIKVILSDRFAPTSEKRLQILSKIRELPKVEVKIYCEKEFLHQKNYIFKTEAEIRVIVASANFTSSGFFRNVEWGVRSIHKPEDPEAVKLISQFETLWRKAKPVDEFIKVIVMNDEPKFEKGENVRIVSSGRIGTINEILPRDGNIAYKVTLDGKSTTYQEKYLEKYIDVDDEITSSFQNRDFKGLNEFYLFQTWFRLKRPIEGNFYSYLASRTLFNPYQFRPLSKFLSPGSENRLFIADEVGTGKTIETGIILTELIARGQIDRRSPILIVCLNSLGPKWIKELKKRFNLNFHLHDGKSLHHTLKSIKNYGIPPDGMHWGIVSIQLIRTTPHLDMLHEIAAAREVPVWAITIIDESHYMRNNTTESFDVGITLSSLSEMMLMLSATPLNLKDDDLFNQMHILNPAMFPDLQTFNALLSPVKSINRCRRYLKQKTTEKFVDLSNELKNLEKGPLGSAITIHPGIIELRKRLLVNNPMTNDEIASFDRLLVSLSPLDKSFTRTLKREALQHQVIREPIKVPVQLSLEEKEFHDAVLTLTENAFLARGGNPASLGFITNTLRRMVSSCIPAMREYLSWCLKNKLMIVGETGDEEPEDDGELKTAYLPKNIEDQYIKLQEMAIKLSDDDTKYNEFIKLIKQMRGNLDNPQIIVFSFFVRTLRYLKEKLSKEGYRVDLISGEIPVISDGIQKSRYEIIEAFERKEFDILLSSEVGGEGLDFQFCQAIINYDLPYNPMRVEQRIGRIDRFGQKSEKIFIASMFIKDTVDEKIYSALYERIKLVQDSIGALEPILGMKLNDFQRDIISGQLSNDQLNLRMQELELAVEQAKIEMAHFENDRKELMGDDLFTHPLHNLDKRAEFVHPSDAVFLTQLCLCQWEKCNFESIDDNRGKITLSKEVAAKLEMFTRRPGSEGCFDELQLLLKGKYPISVVFNGNLADQYADSVFLPPCGFWIKFLLHELESQGNIFRVFSFSRSGVDLSLEHGQYILPLFEIKLEGFRIELDIAAVPLRLKDGLIPSCNFRALSRLIGQKAINPNSCSDFSSINDVNDLIDMCRHALEQQIEVDMEQLKAENRYRINTRINSLKRGSELRIDRINRFINEHSIRSASEGKTPNKEFIRLKEGQISGDQRRTDDSIKKLQEKSELSLTLSLVGIVLLDIE